MKRFWLTIGMVGLMLVGAAGTTAAPPVQQPPRPPTIFQFASNVATVTMADLEGGDLTITLGWHVAHVDGSHTLMLYAYQGYGWKLLHEASETLPAVGNLTVPLEHPGNFGPPTYKLALLDPTGATLDERTLVIPFDQSVLNGQASVIEVFTTDTQSIDAATLAGGVQVPVTWRVNNRLPLTNLVFEQMLDGEQAQNIELPRETLWVPSAGTGAVKPVSPANGSTIVLRLRVLDVITAHVYAEETLSISVTGTAMPPTPEPEANAPPPTPATTQVGNLTVTTACVQGANEALERRWMDGDGIWSPDQQYIVYATNALGDAKLVIARADGSGQVAVEAPDKAFPLGIRPVWSPDSQRLAFANISISQPGGGTVYVIRADGTDLRRIVSYTGYHDDLAWSEDGGRVYFTSGVASSEGTGQVSDYAVFEVTADGLGSPENVTPGCAVR